MSRTIPSASTAPQVVPLPVHHDEQLIPVPFTLGRGTTPAHLRCIRRPKRQAPAADGLVGDDHAPLEQEFLDTTTTQGKAIREPHARGNDLPVLPMLTVGGGTCVHGRLLSFPVILLGHYRNVTIPQREPGQRREPPPHAAGGRLVAPTGARWPRPVPQPTAVCRCARQTRCSARRTGRKATSARRTPLLWPPTVRGIAGPTQGLKMLLRGCDPPIARQYWPGLCSVSSQ